MIFITVTAFFLLLYILLLLYYRRSWVSLKNYVPSIFMNHEELPFVSVIIAARNEEKNISRCIQSLINQSFPQHKFEVIIADDHSTDHTVEVIDSFKRDNIHVLKMSDYTGGAFFHSYKKKSIETAMQLAKGELIITTDADCILPPKWIETITSFYKENNPVFIAAPVLFEDASPNDSFFVKFLKKFQSLDFMTLQGITGASVHKKFHNMCNGANLAYTKKAFLEVKGFEGIDHIASGDDMLLMHKIQKMHPDKILFLKSTDAVVQTQPAGSLKSFINQRIRWASKANQYPDIKISFVLLLVYFINAWMFILGISSFFSIQYFYIFLLALVAKTVVEMIFLFPVADFFDKRKLLWWFVPAQPFHILYTLIAGWLGMFGSYKWKGRKVK